MRTGLTILKNTGVLLLGRVLSIALGVVYVAALSRYIHASGMGVIATATALVSMSALLLNFGLNDVTVRDVAVDKSRAGTYLPNLFLLRGGLFILFAVLVFAAARLAAYPPETLTVIFIYCLAYLFDEFTNVCIAIFNAHEQMEYAAVLQTGRDLLNMGLSLAAIALKANLFVIVGVSALASLVKLFAGLAIVKWKFVLPKPHIDLALCRHLLKVTLPFAALLAISVLVQHMDTFILSLYRPANEVGWYGSAALLINYLLLMPSILLQAVFPVFAKFNAASRDELKRVYSLSFKYLMILGFALSFGTFITADKVINLLYGPGFEQAASALRILSVLLFWIFGYANGSFLNATGGQTTTTKFAVLGLTLTVGLSLFITPRLGLVGAALARITPGALFFVPMTWICHKRLDLPLPYGLALKSLVAALAMTGVSVLALQNQVSLFLVILLIAPLAYAVSLLVLGVIGRSDMELVMQMVRRKKDRGAEEATVQIRP